MLYVSRFEPDEARFAEFLACLWQGEVPSGLQLHKWLYLAGTPRRMLLVWEASDAEAEAFVDRAFGGFGTLDTEVATDDATEGLSAAFARDLDRFGRWMAARGADADQTAHALDVRRRGLEAPDQESAAAAGRAWAGG
jgi:hypothetical protein